MRNQSRPMDRMESALRGIRIGKESGDVTQATGQHHVPTILIMPEHDKDGRHVNTHVHIINHDGTHDVSTHEPGDVDGITAHVGEHYGNQKGEERDFEDLGL